MALEMKVYVGTYAKYNEGSIAGEWVDLSDFSDYGDFIDHCIDLHSDENSPEFMFQDWEGIPDSMIGESWICEGLWDVIDHDDLEALFAFCALRGYDDPNDALSDFEDSYRGEWDSEEDYAEQFFDEIYMHEIPEHLRYYIDISAFTRDLFMGDCTYYDGYVFWNN